MTVYKRDKTISDSLYTSVADKVWLSARRLINDQRLSYIIYNQLRSFNELRFILIKTNAFACVIDNHQ